MAKMKTLQKDITQNAMHQNDTIEWHFIEKHSTGRHFIERQKDIEKNDTYHKNIRQTADTQQNNIQQNDA